MKRHTPPLILASIAMLCFSSIALGDESTELDFNRDLSPILAKNCIACHNARKAEGGLNLESHAKLLEGSDSGAAVEAGKAEESLLIARMASEDDPMPPEDNTVGAKRLTPEELELFRKWVASGAKAPAAESMQSLQWQAVPEGLQPVYALAASPDGNYLSFGRGSTVTIAPQSSGSPDQRRQRLIDPSLNEIVQKNTTGDTSAAALESTHLDIVQSLAFSPDSQRLATGGFRTVKLWRRSTESTRTLDGLSTPNGATSIAPDGQWIAQASGEHALEITDCSSGQSHRFLKVHAAKVTALAWLTDSRRVLSGDASGHMALIDVSNNAVEAVAMSGPIAFHSLCRVNDSRFLAIADNQQLHELTLTVDGAKPSVTTRLIEGFASVVDVDTNSDASQAAIAMSGGKIRLVSLADMSTVKEIDSKLDLKSIRLNGDASLVAALPATGAAQLWTIENGQMLTQLDKDYSKTQLVQASGRDAARQKSLVDRLTAKIPTLQKASEQEVEATKKVQEARDKAAEALAAKVAEVTTATAGVTEAEKALADAQAAVAEAMKLVETKSTELEAKKKAAAEAEQQKIAAEAEVAKRDQALATANDSAKRAAAKIPELEKRIESEKAQLAALDAKLKEVEAEAVATDQPTTLAFSPDGTQIVLAHKDSRVRVFSTRDGTPESNELAVSNIYAMDVTPDNELVCLSDTGVVQRWDLNFPWVLERTLGSYAESPFSDRITALDFSSDGKLLAVGSGPPSRFGDIKLVDPATGEIVRDLGEAHSDTVLSLRFSPDGRQLASAGADKLCRVFDVVTAEQVQALEGHTHHILGVAWKDDGQTLLTASADATIKVWEMENGTQVRTIAGFTKEISAIDFVGQTSQFVLASADGNARLYDANNGNQVRAFGGASNALYAVAVSTDAAHVFSGGQAGQIWSWKLADGKLEGTLP